MAYSKGIFCIIFLFCSFVAVTNSQKIVIDLHEENWSEILKGEWLVEFYAPWCPACKALVQKWKELAQLGPGLGIKIGAVDVTTSPGLSGRFMVTALPTIFHVINGEFRQYKGPRDISSFTSFVEDKKWEQVEPVPSWKSPNSIQMSVVSSFFKLSQLLRQIHNKLTDDYGLPTVASYLIFAIATIILGALLGLILVCAIDLIFPPKHIILTQNKKDEKDSDNELNDEDIRDDLVDDASQSGDGANSDSDSEPKNSPIKRKPRKRRTVLTS
ncbi:unnamed protein product [Diabrotica balteata]|uniref:Thioredoxin domain-containing protein n=1 Tax=Diabrotica balteata TaxID=107213 RepID=A0A9N9T6Q3_DIABA|nr:unnamed protein product [Diabrotica balteata]